MTQERTYHVPPVNRTAEELADDPWRHRSKRMRCATCMWYVRKDTDSPAHNEIGRCRRHAPTMNGYPVVFESDWCGDHKLDETK